MMTETFADTQNVEQSLRDLALQFMEKLMEPDVLRLRRLVIATADRFPDVGRTWYEPGFELLTAQGALNIDDPVMAANHLGGLLLWIPINRGNVRRLEFVFRLGDWGVYQCSGRHIPSSVWGGGSVGRSVCGCLPRRPPQTRTFDRLSRKADGRWLSEWSPSGSVIRRPGAAKAVSAVLVSTPR
jgi:hypothetical protein